MATSESDDFESADEEYNISTKRNIQSQVWSPTTIDSESDDDTEYVPRISYANTVYNKRTEKCYADMDAIKHEKRPDKDTLKKKEDDSINNVCNNERDEQVIINAERTDNEVTFSNLQTEGCAGSDANTITLKVKESDSGSTCADVNKGSTLTEEEQVVSTKSLKRHELSEQEMPEEMKSEKKFKEVFKPEGWEGLGNEIELPEELTEEKLQPILKRLSLAGEENQNSFKGWGWGNWGVSSLLTTATAGVSTLTSHVSHGLTLLEESIAATEEPKSDETSDKDDSASSDNKTEEQVEEYSFGFGNLMSGVSSITKLVESTGSKVMTGGLDTLEAIGKKTMEVLQEGDPGLKKKRAIFKIEADKPILSQVLREAKDKAETVEKTIEEKQKMRKVHFESLFDDYQGLVHLEALEMLSKQSNIKIQQHLIGLNTTELNSVQETLEEVKELCDLGDDDEKDGEITDLKVRLQEICNDLGVNITYERLHTICEESEAYLAPAVTHTDEEIFEHAISILVQFTAFSVERFHKTAELLLIKEHRSTVNEADALVQLTHILSNKIGILANTYCDSLHTLSKTKDTPDNIKTNVTTIFMEASNASSYVQDAFKLLIPIIQVGAI